MSLLFSERGVRSEDECSFLENSSTVSSSTEGKSEERRQDGYVTWEMLRVDITIKLALGNIGWVLVAPAPRMRTVMPKCRHPLSSALYHWTTHGSRQTHVVISVGDLCAWCKSIIVGCWRFYSSLYVDIEYGIRVAGFMSAWGYVGHPYTKCNVVTKHTCDILSADERSPYTFLFFWILLSLCYVF